MLVRWSGGGAPWSPREFSTRMACEEAGEASAAAAGGHLEGGARAVGGLEAELVERGLQRLGVARARVARATDGVDVGGLLRERLLLQGRFRRRGDLLGARVAALELHRGDLHDLAVLDGHAHLGVAVPR